MGDYLLAFLFSMIMTNEEHKSIKQKPMNNSAEEVSVGNSTGIEPSTKPIIAK